MRESGPKRKTRYRYRCKRCHWSGVRTEAPDKCPDREAFGPRKCEKVNESYRNKRPELEGEQ